MIIQREMTTGDYHIARDDTFQDEELSWEARGVLAYLFSKPEDWTPRMYDIVNHGPCKKHKVKSIFEELEEAGYMSRQKYRAEDGTFDWKVTVADHPQFDPGWTESTPDGDHPGRDQGYNKKDSQPEGHNNKKEQESAHGGDEDSASLRDRDPEGVQVWVDVTGTRPNIATRESLKQIFAGTDGLRWDATAFRQAVDEAYLNCDGDAHRIAVGTLKTQYKKKLEFGGGDGAPREVEDEEAQNKSGRANRHRN